MKAWSVMKNTWGLALCGRARVLEKGSGEDIGESVANYFRDATIVGWPSRAAWMGWMEPARSIHKAACAAENGAREGALWSTPADCEWITDTGCWVILFEFWLSFVQIVTVTWFFPLGSRKNLIYFCFYRIPQLRDLEFFSKKLNLKIFEFVRTIGSFKIVKCFILWYCC